MYIVSVCQPLTANVTLLIYSGFTSGVAAKVRLRNCLTLSWTHTYMLWNQLKGTETSLVLSFPQTADPCVLVLNGVCVLLNRSSLTLCLGACLLLRDKAQLSIWFMPRLGPWLWLQSGRNKSKELFIQCCNCRKCWRRIYISFRASRRLCSSCEGPAHYHMHGGRRENVHTCIFRLRHASEGRLNYARPSSSARTYLQ